MSFVPGTDPSSLAFHLSRGPSSRKVHGNPPKLLPTSNLTSSSQMLWALPFKYTQSLTPLPTYTTAHPHTHTLSITPPGPSTGLFSPALPLQLNPNMAFFSSEPSCGFPHTMISLSQWGFSEECFNTMSAHWMLIVLMNSVSTSIWLCSLVQQVNYPLWPSFFICKWKGHRSWALRH